ncbi:MAG TPA: DUF4126 domain-containing protein [Usitatibacter sp.]|nr:DUF4126 domain-containing protein [Usitatibacter sp.]
MGGDWQTLQSIVMAALLAWASGVRLYLVVFGMGLAGRLGYVDLPSGLQVLENPFVIGAAGLMLVVEFLVDKVPGMDSVWDFLHTFVRIPAGAFLAAGATSDQLPALTLAAGLIGGSITAGTHFAKSAARATVNASPEPFSNWGLAFSEDALVIGGAWLAFNHPFAFGAALAVFLVLAVWLLVLLRRVLRLAFDSARRKLAATPSPG